MASHSHRAYILVCMAEQVCDSRTKRKEKQARQPPSIRTRRIVRKWKTDEDGDSMGFMRCSLSLRAHQRDTHKCIYSM